MESKEATFKLLCTSFAIKYWPKRSIYDSQVFNASSYGPTFPMMSAILDS